MGNTAIVSEFGAGVMLGALITIALIFVGTALYGVLEIFIRRHYRRRAFRLSRVNHGIDVKLHAPTSPQAIRRVAREGGAA